MHVEHTPEFTDDDVFRPLCPDFRIVSVERHISHSLNWPMQRLRFIVHPGTRAFEPGCGVAMGVLRYSSAGYEQGKSDWS